MIGSSTEKSSEGKSFQQCSVVSNAESLPEAHTIKQEIEQTNRTPSRMLDNSEAKSEQVVPSNSDDCFSGRLQPGYTKPSIPVDSISRSPVTDCRRLSCFRNLGTDEEYKHVTPFLPASLIWYLHWTNNLLREQSALFLWDLISVYNVAGTVIERGLDTDLSHYWDIAMQLADKPLGLSCLAELRTELLQQMHATLQRFVDPYEHR